MLPQPVELNGARICAISTGVGCANPLRVAISEAGQCLWWDSDAPHDKTHVEEVAERIVGAAADAQTGRILAIDAVGHLHSVDCAGEDYDSEDGEGAEQGLNRLKFMLNVLE